MTPIYQTPHHPRGGNCLQACIASILEVDINDIPDFMDLPTGEENRYWLRDLMTWLEDHGYGMIYLKQSKEQCNVGFPAINNCWIISVGTSPRGGIYNGHNIDHAVITKATTLFEPGKYLVDLHNVHDPVGSDQFLEGMPKYHIIIFHQQPLSSVVAAVAA